VEGIAIWAPQPRGLQPANVPSARTEARLAELRNKARAAVNAVDRVLGAGACGRCAAAASWGVHVPHWHTCATVEHRSHRPAVAAVLYTAKKRGKSKRTEKNR